LSATIFVTEELCPMMRTFEAPSPARASLSARSSIRRVTLPIVVLCAVLVGASSASAAVTERMSVASDGTEALGQSGAPAISADGRYVAFASNASNLVPNDTNDNSDVFVRDRSTGETTLVSVNSSGVQGRYASSQPDISANGRLVVFRSESQLDQSFSYADGIFVHDLDSGETTRVNVSDPNATSNNYGSSFEPAISADGRVVVFRSYLSNLVLNGRPGYGPGCCIADIFARDLVNKVTTRVSVGSDGTPANGDSIHPDVGKGGVVVFQSAASNLVAGDTNGQVDVFARDLDFAHPDSGTTTRVSVASDGTEALGQSGAPAISADDGVVVFQSAASNLVDGDTNGTSDVFSRGLGSGTTTRVSTSSAGAEADGGSFGPSVSADGGVVVFYSVATDLVAGDTNGYADVFARDVGSGVTTRVSVGSAGDEANGASIRPDVNADGGVVVFQSVATNLVAGDTNGQVDDFARSGSAAVPSSEGTSPSGGGTLSSGSTTTPGGGTTPPGGGTTVPSAAAAVDVTAPVLGALSLSPAVFRAAGSGASIASRVGTRVSYELSEAAGVRFRVERAVGGRRVGGRCVRTTSLNRGAPRCVRYRTLAGGFADQGVAGQNRLVFRGRLGGRKLTPGRYRLRGVAVDAAGNRSARTRVTFRIVRR